MADNVPPPVPGDVRPAPQNTPPPLRRRSPLGLLLVLIFGILLGQFYISYVVPRFSTLPTTYPKPNFQNKSASYYDVLNISPDASAAKIKLAYETQLSYLSSTNISSSLSPLNFTIRAKVIEAKNAFSTLQNGSRCLYDFEVLGLGIRRYLHCIVPICWEKASWSSIHYKLKYWVQGYATEVMKTPTAFWGSLPRFSRLTDIISKIFEATRHAILRISFHIFSRLTDIISKIFEAIRHTMLRISFPRFLRTDIINNVFEFIFEFICHTILHIAYGL